MKTALTILVAASFFNSILPKFESNPKSGEITSKQYSTNLIQSNLKSTHSEPGFEVLSAEDDDDCSTVPPACQT